MGSRSTGFSPLWMLHIPRDNMFVHFAFMVSLIYQGRGLALAIRKFAIADKDHMWLKGFSLDQPN